MRISKKGKLLYANDASKEVLEIWKTGINETVPPEWQKMIKEVFNNKNIILKEEKVKDRFFSFAITSVADTGYVNIYARDITERKRMEETKRNLIRDLSHGIKTPIAMTEMAIGRCGKGIKRKDSEEIAAGYKIASKSIQRLRKDVDNIIKAFTLDVAIITTTTKEILIKDILSEIANDNEGLLEMKGLRLIINVRDNAGRMRFNEKYLKIILSNIIDNAIKFSDKGDIFIESVLEGEKIKIKVKDAGCGIRPEGRDRIFERFYRQHPAVGGTGLGLSISKDIILMFGGDIKVNSEGEGKGTTVALILPCK